jgi:hypothetical protein
VTGNSNTSPLNQSRTRRAAALTANKKIQDVVESNASQKKQTASAQPSKDKGGDSMIQEEEPGGRTSDNDPFTRGSWKSWQRGSEDRFNYPGTQTVAVGWSGRDTMTGRSFGTHQQL